MNAEHEMGIRAAVEAAMSTLTIDDLRELVFEPYREFSAATIVSQAA